MNIRVKRVLSGKIETVDIEKYVAGVVAAELGSATGEALKCQAVASRTYGIYHINLKNSYDVTDDTRSQVYRPDKVTTKITEAVNATKGQVITYNGKIANTVYSASNGGKIRSSKEVWGGNVAYLVSKDDPYTKRSGKPKNGHGVGMSQWGVMQGSSEGVSYTKLLDFYYPGTKLVTNYGGTSSSAVKSNTTSITNLGKKVVEFARKQIGKPYVYGGKGPNNFDCSGFTWYCYKNAINFSWSYGVVSTQYNYKTARTVSKDSLAPGDLVFFHNTSTNGGNPPLSHIGIATGDGKKFIHAGSSTGVAERSLDESYYKQHFYAARRILTDAEVSETDSDDTSLDENINYIENNIVSPTPSESAKELIAGMVYSAENDKYLKDTLEIRDYIQEGAKAGYNYGYLVDLTNGGEFKFLVPDYDISVTTNWTEKNVLGRSVDLRGYDSTGSKSITVSLELIAGVGMYASGTDKVGALHDDINFLRSLQYPDYSKAMVFPPATVYLYLNDYAQVRGVVTDLSTKYQRPFDVNNKPMRADVSFTVTQVSDNPPDYSDIRGRKDNSI